MTTHIYFVAETKGSLASMDLRGIEQTKWLGLRGSVWVRWGAKLAFDA